jgi:hypothetical protein
MSSGEHLAHARVVVLLRCCDWNGVELRGCDVRLMVSAGAMTRTTLERLKPHGAASRHFSRW